MMSCLTWGNRFGRRAPHLTDDVLAHTSCSAEQRATPRPVILAAALQTQAHRRGDQTLRARRRELFVQRVAEAAAFIHCAHGVPGQYFFLHPRHELRPGVFARWGDHALIALDGRDDVAQVHVQAQRVDLSHCGLVSRRRKIIVGFGMRGSLDCFHISACALFAHAAQPFMPSNPALRARVVR
jgi:hypothetical protein